MRHSNKSRKVFTQQIGNEDVWAESSNNIATNTYNIVRKDTTLCHSYSSSAEWCRIRICIVLRQ